MDFFEDINYNELCLFPLDPSIDMEFISSANDCSNSSDSSPELRCFSVPESPQNESTKESEEKPAVQSVVTKKVEAKTTNKRRAARKKKSEDYDFEPTLSSEDSTPDVDDEDFSNDAKGAAKPKSVSRKRKSKATVSDINDYGESVILSREHLLIISSSEYEQLVQRIGQMRSLTDEEVKEIRRQKRLIKNRESAALSRDRKRQAMDTLEAENAKLKAELEAYKAKFSVAEDLMKKAGQMKQFLEKVGAPIGKSNGTNVGMMFIVLFSFGLFLYFPAISVWTAQSKSPQFSSSSSPVVATPAKDIANLRRLFGIEEMRHEDLRHEDLRHEELRHEDNYGVNSSTEDDYMECYHHRQNSNSTTCLAVY